MADKPVIEYTDQQIADYIAENFGNVTADNLQDIVDLAVAENVPIEQVARAIGAQLTTTDEGYSFSIPASVKPKIDYTDQQIADYIAENYGTVTAENLQQVVNEAVAENVPIEQVARAIGAKATPTDGGYSFALQQEAEPVIDYTDQQIADYIAENYGDVTANNIQDIVNEAVAENVPIEQVARAIGANVEETDQGYSFSLPAAAAPVIDYTDQQIADYIAQTYGDVTADNIQEIVNEAAAENVPIEQVARAIGASLTPTEGGYSFSLPQAAATPTFTDQQVSDYIAQNFGAVTSANFSDVINGAYAQGFSPEQIARATGATANETAGGFSFTLPAPPPIEYTDQQILDYIAENYGTVSGENFQSVVDKAVAEGVPLEQLARVVGAEIDTNESGQTLLNLPAAAQEAKPLSLVEQLKAQQQVTGINHQASFSKDQNAIIEDMAEKLGKYGVQSLEDLKPITGEIEYQLEERPESPGTFNLMQLGIGPEGEEQWQYAGRAATADEINQIRTKGTVTENIGVLNARTGEEIPVNELNNAKGSGFTYYKIEFSPDGVAVPYGYKEATGAGALGDQIKSIVSIPPIAAALAAVAAPIVGSALSVSAPTAAAISAGTVGYAGSGRLDTAAKAAATAFGVTYAMQSLGLDLTSGQAERVNAVKDLPGYDSFNRTVDLGGGLTYDPVTNSVIDANFGTTMDAATGDIEFPDGSIATSDDYGIYRNADAAPAGAQVTPVTPGSPIVSTSLSPTTQPTVTVTGTATPAIGALAMLPVGTMVRNPTTGNMGTITVTADGVKQIADVASAATATGIQTLSPGTAAQVNVTGTRGTAGQAGAGAASAVVNPASTGTTTARVDVTGTRGTTDQTGAGAGAGTAGTGATTTQVDVTGAKKDTESLGSGLSGVEYKYNPTTGKIEVVEVTGTRGNTSSAGAGAAAAASTGVLANTVNAAKKLADGKYSELTADEIEALVKAGLLVTMVTASPDSPDIPTTNVDTTLINTIRPGVSVDLNPTIPGATTTTIPPGQQTYNLLGINTGKPTTQPTVPTTGIGSIPVPRYNPPPFLGGPAPGASRIVSPVVTADPTITQADIDTAAADIAAQQAALPPIVQPVPATPFESGLAKGTEVGMRRGGLAALYAGGPVTGQPQYFAKGGETMAKYTPQELESTFDMSEYIDPDTGRFKVFEYERDVVYNPRLKAAEAEERMTAAGASREEIEAIIEEILSRNEKKLAYGGMTGPVNQPRMLSGGGDGMSDSIPATIDGTQPARLADGEFVIPADVVADIGNGSSRAGAKQLYAMMDRVRESRHGTTKQPPEVNMKKVLPF
jgi:(2Fe-2S) ferredoxin